MSEVFVWSSYKPLDTAKCTCRSVGLGKLVVKSVGDVVGRKLSVSANGTVLL